MKAITINKQEIEYGEIPIDLTLEKWEVLVKVEYVWLCWSDKQKITDKNFIQSNVLWHEIVWRAVKTSNENLINKTIVVNPLVECWKCIYCKQGQIQLCKDISWIWRNLDWWFAEYVKVREENVRIIPDNMEKRSGILIDSMAVAIHGINLIWYPFAEKRKMLIIWGWIIWIVVGIILSDAWHEVSILSKKNFSVIKDIFNLNAFDSVQGSEAETFDVVIETIWRNQSDSINLAIEMTKRGWTLLTYWVFPENFDKSIKLRQLLYKEIRLIGSNSFWYHSWKSEFDEAIDLFQKYPDRFSKLITDEFPISEFMQWFLKSESTWEIKISFKI